MCKCTKCRTPVVFSSENVQIVRLTAGENVLGARRILSAGNVLETFNLEAHTGWRWSVGVSPVQHIDHVVAHICALGEMVHTKELE